MPSGPNGSREKSSLIFVSGRWRRSINRCCRPGALSKALLVDQLFIKGGLMNTAPLFLLQSKGIEAGVGMVCAAVRSNLLETKTLVQGPGWCHARQGIQTKFAVSRLFSGMNNGLDKAPAQPQTSIRWPYIQSLHLGNTVAQRLHCHAARNRRTGAGDIEATRRRCIRSRQ
jgi:hypothetical protein